MAKKLGLIFFVLVFLVGCVPFDLIGSGNSSNGGGSNNNSNMEPTIASLLTSEPELHPTATLFQPQTNYNPTPKPTPTSTQVIQPSAPTATSQAISTPSPSSSITLTTVENGSDYGDAYVYWNASGAFPSGFKVLWSATNSAPAYPEDLNLLISDPGARSTIVHAQAGKNYYFRVCRYTNGGCDTYSNVYTFTLASQVLPTKTTASNSITIKKVETINTGEAQVTWAVTGSFPNGFKVVWSPNTQTPTYPENSAVYAGADARTAIVTGTPGTNYYIRVCKYNGSGCDFYSATYNHTFPNAPATTQPVTITITEMLDKHTGAAYIKWSATGSFPMGFKIAWSPTNPNPVYPPDTGGLWSYISDGSARTAVVEGTPGTTYYFRVCEYLGGSCGAYSNSYTFTFAAAPEPTAEPTVDTSSITLVSVEKKSEEEPTKAKLTWTASGSFPSGFKIIWSATNSNPMYPDAMDGAVHTSETFGYTPPLNSGTTYNFRVCKYSEVIARLNNLGFLLFGTLNTVSTSSCTVYSNVLTYTVP